MATSVRRDEARAISSAATFAQAISSTNPTAPCNSSERPADEAEDAIAEGLHANGPRLAVVRFTRRKLPGKRAPMESISLCACCRVTPGFSLPATVKNRADPRS